MKIIKYQYLSAMVGNEPYLIGKIIPCSAEGEELAKEEAYNGEYTIEDDGQPEPDTVTTDDVLNTLLGVTV